MSFASRAFGLHEIPKVQLHVPTEVIDEEGTSLTKKVKVGHVEMNSSENVMLLHETKLDPESYPKADFECRVTLDKVGNRLRIANRPNENGIILNKKFPRADPLYMTKFCNFLINDIIEDALQQNSLQCCLVRYEESSAAEYVKSLEVLQGFVNSYGKVSKEDEKGEYFLCSYSDGFSLQYMVKEKKDKREGEEEESGDEEESDDDDTASHVAYFIVAICDYTVYKV